MGSWKIKKMSGHCGARLEGVSLVNASKSDLEEMQSALFEYGVIVLPDQNLTPENHINLAEFFGPIDINRFFTPVASHPMIAEVRTSAGQSAVLGGTWHTDHSYDAAPAMCSILSAQQLPPYGGDTHFASMTAAYEALSPGLKKILTSLRAWHSDSSFSESNVGLESNLDAFRNPVLHPVIIKHPVTNEPCVYVNGDFTTHFENWSREESFALLSYLYTFVTQPIFTARVVWEPGMVAIWDNRLVQHYATADYAGNTRLMHRITVEGVPLESAYI
jgi:taurine dioxygenase